MPNVFWEFSVAYSTGVELSPTSIGINAASAMDVEELGKFSGLEVTGWDRDGTTRRKIEVSELESSERLRKLLSGIKDKYGFKPSPSRIVPIVDRYHVFGLIKRRVYREDEIDSAELLYISFVEQAIADFGDRTEEEIDAERYAVESGNKRKVISLGNISPFLAIAVTGELKSRMESMGVIGLKFEPVINGDDLWKLTSSITMPRCRLPIVNSQGETVDPEKWPGKWSDKYYDDAGYEPPELHYLKSEIDLCGTFDIAVTAERTGGYNKTAFRRLVLNQRFREVLSELGVKGVCYTPVRIND